MSSFNNKVIAITGAASGIGLATAKLLASRGAKLAIADVQAKALEQAVSELKSAGAPDVVSTVVDVSKNESVDSWIAETVKHFGRLDGAANVAGVEGKTQVLANLTEMLNEDWDFIISVNLTGVMYCLRAELRVMERGAAIVNVSSIAGLMGRPGIGAYSASKHGVVGLTKGAAKEVGKRGIRVNAVAPGPIQTPMLDRLLAVAKDTPITSTYANLPLGKLGTADDVARTIVFLLSDDSGFTTGCVYPVDGGATC